MYVVLKNTSYRIVSYIYTFIIFSIFWNTYQDLVSALHSLGISPTEQEVIDMQNEVERKGKIFFPDFCKLSLRKFREFDENHFRQELFKVRLVYNTDIFYLLQIQWHTLHL